MRKIHLRLLLLMGLSTTQANIFSGVFTALASFNPFSPLDYEHLDEKKSYPGRLKQSAGRKRHLRGWKERKPVLQSHREPPKDMENAIWEQTNQIEEEIKTNEFIDDSLFDEVFDDEYGEPELGREFWASLQSYEAVPSDDQLQPFRMTKTDQKQMNISHIGTNRQTKPSKNMESLERFTGKTSNTQEEKLKGVISHEEESHYMPNSFQKHKIDQPQFNEIISQPQAFISWGRQHLPSRELSNPSPPASYFASQSDHDVPTLRNLLGSSPPTTKKGPGHEVNFPRPKRNEASGKRDGFNPPQISYYFTVDDAMNRKRF